MLTQRSGEGCGDKEVGAEDIAESTSRNIS